MKILVLFASIFFVLGCTTQTKMVDFQPPVGIENSTRTIASDEIEKRFNEYFIVGNYHLKLKKTLAVANQFLARMPDKGHAKKRLVKQLVSDLTRVTQDLADNSLVKVENNNLWTPVNTGHPEYVATVRAIGSVVQSGKIMEQMGIYLSASGVVEEDSAEDQYYFEMLARALAEFDRNLSRLMIAYPPEQKNLDENNARLRYAKRMANEIRAAIRKNFESNTAFDGKKIDRAMLQLSKAVSLRQANQLLKNPDYRYTKNVMANLHISNSQDIMGFQDDVDLTLATKFSFEIINELISKVR